MITINKYWKPGCKPCEVQNRVFVELRKEIEFTLQEVNVLELDRSEVIELGIKGVPYLEIYKDGVKIHTGTGLHPIEKLREILA